MNWRGENNKINNLKYNTITPVFHSQLESETHIKCCCNAPLQVDSEYYVFRVTSKPESKYPKNEFIHAGNTCGKTLLELSNQYNNTNYLNILFFRIGECNTIENVTQKYGLRDYRSTNKPHSQYTAFNKEYLLAIFIVCQEWNEPFPYGKFADAITAIHQNPEIDQDLHIEFFNNAIAKGKKTLIELLGNFRISHPAAFPNEEFNLLHKHIIDKVLKSNIK